MTCIASQVIANLIKGFEMGQFIGVGLVLWLVVAWFVHVATCFVEHAWGFLIAGAIFFPIAWVHGTGVILGWW